MQSSCKTLRRMRYSYLLFLGAIFQQVIKGPVCRSVNFEMYFWYLQFSHKRTIKFDFTTCRLVFIRCLEESEDTKNTFRN